MRVPGFILAGIGGIGVVFGIISGLMYPMGGLVFFLALPFLAVGVFLLLLSDYIKDTNGPKPSPSVTKAKRLLLIVVLAFIAIFILPILVASFI